MSRTVIIQVSESELESLRETCSVRKHNPFGLSVEEYTRGVYLINGKYKNLKKLLEKYPNYPMKIKVIMEE